MVKVEHKDSGAWMSGFKIELDYHLLGDLDLIWLFCAPQSSHAYNETVIPTA